MNEPVDYISGSSDGSCGCGTESPTLPVGPPPPADNFPIEDRRLGAPGFPNHQAVPRSLYFYYLRINKNGQLYVTHHFYPGGEHDDVNNPANPDDWPEIPYDKQGLTDLVRKLALDARPSGDGEFPVIGRDFLDIQWCRKSYVAIFVDEANWKLPCDNGMPCIKFITGPDNPNAGTENHTFFDAMKLDIEMPISGSTRTDTRTAVVFLNHMKGDGPGRELILGDRQTFKFDIYFDVAYASGAPAMKVIFDPGGTNLGPPVPPP